MFNNPAEPLGLPCLDDMIHIHELDRILMEKYYPPIKRALEKTEYPYSAEEFAGMIPGLTIQPSVLIPAQDTYFHITLEAEADVDAFIALAERYFGAS